MKDGNTPGSKGFANSKSPGTGEGLDSLKINVKNCSLEGGGGEMEKGIKKIEKDLLARHADDPIKLAKVHRYIRFLRIDLKCDADIDNDGTTIRVENGSQNFLKQHPAIATKLSISKEIEKLEDALGIKVDTPAPSASSTVDEKGRKSLI